MVSLEGYVQQDCNSIQEITAPDKPGAEPVRIVLVKTAVIPGIVKDMNGKPIEDVRISRKFPGNNSAPEWASVKTDSQGRFEMSGFTPGITRISVTHKEYAAQYNARVVIEPSKSLQDARIVMTQGGSVEGVVYDAEGKPVPGAYVFGAGESCQTYREGRFRADLVPPGEINIWASGMNLKDYRSASLNVEEGRLIQVEVRPGQDGTKETGRSDLNK